MRRSLFGGVVGRRRDLQNSPGEALRIERAAGGEAQRLGIIEPAVEAAPRAFHVCLLAHWYSQFLTLLAPLSAPPTLSASPCGDVEAGGTMKAMR